MRRITGRFPMLTRLGHSYGEGAREEVRRRSGSGIGSGFGSGVRQGEMIGEGGERVQLVDEERRAEVFTDLEPAAAERFQIGELEDVPLQSSGEEGDDEGEDEDGEWDPLDSQHAFVATRRDEMG